MPVQHKFTITDQGRDYSCSRIVTGEGTKKQIVCVEGVGTRADPIEYGSEAHPEFAMSASAKVIALELLSDRRSAKRSPDDSWPMV